MAGRLVPGRARVGRHVGKPFRKHMQTNPANRPFKRVCTRPFKQTHVRSLRSISSQRRTSLTK